MPKSLGEKRASETNGEAQEKKKASRKAFVASPEDAENAEPKSYNVVRQMLHLLLESIMTEADA